MEQQLVSGKDRIKELCQQLKGEALEPARQQSEQIIQQAHQQAEQVLQKARDEAALILQKASEKIEREKAIFRSTVDLAAKQAVQYLRQEIEDKLFNQGLDQLIQKPLIDPVLITKVVQTMIGAIEREGLSQDFSVIVPKSIPLADLQTLLGQQILRKLKEGQCLHGQIAGGIQVRLNDKHVTLDFSDTFIKELLASYLRRDFRQQFLAAF